MTKCGVDELYCIVRMHPESTSSDQSMKSTLDSMGAILYGLTSILCPILPSVAEIDEDNAIYS